MNNEKKVDSRDKIVVLLAGGRIVQRQTKPDLPCTQLSVEELEELLAAEDQELKEQASFQPWSTSPISTYSLRMCSDIIHVAASCIKDDGAAGVVITCGMSGIVELAYYADLVWNMNAPLIFTSSIFHADGHGSETALRLSQCIRAAKSSFCAGKGAMICLKDALYSPADLLYASSSDRAGIHAMPNAPLAVFLQPSDELYTMRQPKPRVVKNTELLPARNIVILETSLGENDLLLKALSDAKWRDDLDGVVISAFGDGDVPPSWVSHIRKLIRCNVPVVLSSRCPGGIVQTTDVFEGSASQLLDMGVIGAGMLSPLQARIKLAIAIGDGLRGDDMQKYIESN